jgi:CheY-like chemotaxis protein
MGGVLIDPVTRGILVIAVSADAMPDRVETGIAAGFHAYVIKPIDFATPDPTRRHHEES